LLVKIITTGFANIFTLAKIINMIIRPPSESLLAAWWVHVEALLTSWPWK